VLGRVYVLLLLELVLGRVYVVLLPELVAGRVYVLLLRLVLAGVEYVLLLFLVVVVVEPGRVVVPVLRVAGLVVVTFSEPDVLGCVYPGV
jgi:hypothetical protein